MSAALAATVAGLLVATAACGAVEEATSPPSSGFLTPAETASTPASESATSVRLVVSGGISGAVDVHEVRRGEPADGLTPQQVDRVLELAASDPVRALGGARPVGPQPCCDIRQLTLTVAYDDGTRTRVRTQETESMPPELRRLVTLLSRAP